MDTTNMIASLSRLDKATQWATYTMARLATVPADVDLTPLLRSYRELAAKVLSYDSFEAVEQAAVEYDWLAALGGEQAISEMASIRA